MWRRLLVIALLFSATPVYAEEFNAGFVQGLWFSHEPFFADESVRIYAAVRNNTGADLTGTVRFYVDDVIIESVRVSALDGRIIEAWADWTPGYGTSSISATLARTEISSDGSNEENITVSAADTAVTEFIDHDTDGDGIGNLTDTDDDGDGVSDADELAAGTDPLVVDVPEPEAETEEDETTDDADSESGTTANSSTDDQPEGLEQYLDENRADSAFTAITNTINTTKKRLDEYREERSDQVEEVAPETPQTNTTDDTSYWDGTTTDGFGEVTRDQGEPKQAWTTTLWQAIAAIVSAIYTVLLAVLSFLLGYPSLIQILLLLFILWLLYKLAKRFGSRPQ